MSGTRHIRKAVDILHYSRAPLRDRLLEAVAEWSEALHFRQSWPLPLRGRADCISQRLMLHDTAAQAIAAMDDSELHQLASDIIAFAKDADIWTQDQAQTHLEPSHFFG